jgi:hypothetical protein
MDNAPKVLLSSRADNHALKDLSHGRSAVIRTGRLRISREASSNRRAKGTNVADPLDEAKAAFRRGVGASAIGLEERT